MTKTLPIPGEEFVVDACQAFLILPEKPRTDRLTPWVWYAPTLPKLPGPEETWMFRRFLDAGIAIAGIDVGESYGSPRGRAVFCALYRHLTQQRQFSRKACLLARSRGGLMLYNWAAENANCVACIAGIYPVCNIVSFPGVARACGAYDIGADELAAQLAKHNPIERLAPLAKAGVPIFHIHGDADEVVPLENNSGELARRYRELGGAIELVVPTGQGHNMWDGFFRCDALIEFLIENALSDE